MINVMLPKIADLELLSRIIKIDKNDIKPFKNKIRVFF